MTYQSHYLIIKNTQLNAILMNTNILLVQTVNNTRKSHTGHVGAEKKLKICSLFDLGFTY